jgi:predicted nuclease with TOPRIM domain
MNSNTRPNFWQRLLLAFVKTVLAILILAGLAVGGFLAFREMQRSFDSVTARVDINRRDLEALQREVKALAVEAPDQQREIETLALETEALDERLSALNEQVADGLAQHQQLLTALEERLSLAASSGETALERIDTASSDAATLSAAIVALQGDLNESNGRIDALGGEVDGLRAENEMLDASVADLSQLTASAVEAAAEVDEMQRTLALFHVWELVARARLRLVERNFGLAAADVERAFRAIDVLVATGLEDDDEALKVTQTRLALSFNSLPDNSAVAARDLENAWDELGRILTSRVLPDLAIGDEVEAGELVTEEVSPEPMPTPTPGP